MRRNTIVGISAVCLLSVALAAQDKQAADKIPITTSSAEARQLYLKGRDLAEKLRATDARRFYEQLGFTPFQERLAFAIEAPDHQSG